MAQVATMDPVYSDAVTYLVTPYSTDLPKMYLPGGYQNASGYGNDWTQTSAPTIAASSFGGTDYEGFFMVATPQTNPDNQGFKISSQPNWSGDNYGDGGSNLLSTSGGNILVPNAGYYRLRATIDPETPTLTYNLEMVSWGMIGAATPGGWDNDTDLIYNPATQKLEIASVALVPGMFKFRGNDAWSNGFDFGTVNSDGFLTEGGDLTFDGPAGNYKVTLDLSNPRKYTYSIEPVN